MMWKILHKLFGWDYILIESGGKYVEKIFLTPNGKPYVKWPGPVTLIDMKGNVLNDSITKNYVPLTF